MEKTITIDGRQVRFKSTAATPLRYKAQFGRDFFSEILKMKPIIEAVEGANKERGTEDIPVDFLEKIDFELFYNLIWVLAKTADKTIPEPMEWLDEFSEFPIMDILPELQDLIAGSFKGKKK